MPERKTKPDTTVSQDRCPDCGAPVPGGRDGCQSTFDELSAEAYCNTAYAALHPLAFDTYCMQHLDRYCRSAKSYAAHLTRLCCGLEYDGSTKVYEAIQKWLNGPVAIAKPALLADLGHITVADVRKARTAKEYARLVRAWAENVWAAYAVQHDLAREWIRIALTHRS